MYTSDTGLVHLLIDLVWRASPFTREEGSGVMPTRFVLAAQYSAVQYQSDRYTA